MLHDSQTDLVFIPMAIRYHFPRLYRSLIAAFRKAHIKCWEIPYTSDKNMFMGARLDAYYSR